MENEVFLYLLWCYSCSYELLSCIVLWFDDKCLVLKRNVNYSGLVYREFERFCEYFCIFLIGIG